jgi:hypothetical protein
MSQMQLAYVGWIIYTHVNYPHKRRKHNEGNL